MVGEDSMAENSKIEWTDHTFNPWIGCSKVHEGCTHCYAEEQMDKRWAKAKWGPAGTRTITSEANWAQPLKWNRAAENAGVRARVFCASLADVFEDWAEPFRLTKNDMRVVCGQCGWFGVAPIIGPKAHECPECKGEWVDITMPAARRALFDLIDATPWLDWLLLTKRPENIRRMWPGVSVNSEQQANDRNERGELYRRNVWIGASISLQEHANRQLAPLLSCKDLARVAFISVEPLLGPIDLRIFEGIDWVIVGGESGPKARACDVDWIRSLRDQCQADGVPVFIKQLGANCQLKADPDNWDWPASARFVNGTAIVDLRDSKGGDWSEWPDDLRVREFPEPKEAKVVELQSAPAWHARPKCPGRWLSSGGIDRYMRDERDIEDAAAMSDRWFGPIPECDIEPQQSGG